MDQDLVGAGSVYSHQAGCDHGIIAFGTAADLFGILLLHEADIADPGCILRLDGILVEGVGDGAVGVLRLQGQALRSLPAHGALGGGIVGNFHFVTHKSAKQCKVFGVLVCLGRFADRGIAQGIHSFFQFVLALSGGQRKVDLGLGGFLFIGNVLPYLGQAQLGIIEACVDVGLVVASGQHGIAQGDFITQSSPQGVGGVAVLLVGLVGCILFVITLCYAQLAKGQDRLAAVLLHLVAGFAVREQDAIVALLQVFKGVAAITCSGNGLYRVAQRIRNGIVAVTGIIGVNGFFVLRIRLRLHQRYDNACQRLVRTNVLFSGVVQFGGVNAVMVLIHPDQTADGTAAHLDGCRGAGDGRAFGAAAAGKVAVAVDIAALLGRFLVSIRQQDVGSILFLRHSQHHMHLDGAVGQLCKLQVQAAQVAVSAGGVDGHLVQGIGRAVSIGGHGAIGVGKRSAAGSFCQGIGAFQRTVIAAHDGLGIGVAHGQVGMIPRGHNISALLHRYGDLFQGVGTVEFLAVVGQHVTQFQVAGSAALVHIGQIVGQIAANLHQVCGGGLIDDRAGVLDDLDLGGVRAAEGCVDAVFLVGAVDLGIDDQVLVPGVTVIVSITLNILCGVGRVADARFKGKHRQGLLHIGNGGGQVQAGGALCVILGVVTLKFKVHPFMVFLVPVLVLGGPGQVAAVVAAVAVVKGQGAFLQGQVLGQGHIQRDVGLGQAVKDLQVLFHVALHRDLGRDLHGHGTLAVVQLVVGLADVAAAVVSRSDVDRCILRSNQHRVACGVAAVAAADLVAVAVLGLLVIVAHTGALHVDLANVPVLASILFAGQPMILRGAGLLAAALDQVLVQQGAAGSQRIAVFIHKAGPASTAAVGQLIAEERPVGRPAAHVGGKGVAAADLAGVGAGPHHMPQRDRAAIAHAAVADLVQHGHAGVACGFQFGQGVVIDKARDFFRRIAAAAGGGVEAVVVHVGGAAVIAGVERVVPKGLAFVQGCTVFAPAGVGPAVAFILVADGCILCLSGVQYRQVVVLGQFVGGIPLAVTAVGQVQQGNAFQLGGHLVLGEVLDRLLLAVHRIGDRAHSIGVKLHQNIVGGQVVILGLFVHLRIIQEFFRIVGRRYGHAAVGQVGGHVQLAAHAGDVGAQLGVALVVQHGRAVAAQPVVGLVQVVDFAIITLGNVHAHGSAIVVVIVVVSLVFGVLTQLFFAGVGEITVDLILQRGILAVHFLVGQASHLHIARHDVHVGLEEALVVAALGEVVLLHIQRDDDLQVAAAELIRRAALAHRFHRVAMHQEVQLTLGHRGAVFAGEGAVLAAVRHGPGAAAVGVGHVEVDAVVVVALAVVIVLIAPVHVYVGGVIVGVIAGRGLVAVGFVGPQARVDGDFLRLIGVIHALAVKVQPAAQRYVEGDIPAGHRDTAQALVGILVAQLQGQAVTGHHAVDDILILRFHLLILALGDLHLVLHIEVADMAQGLVVIHGQVVGRLGRDRHRIGKQFDMVSILVGIGLVAFVAAVIEPCLQDRLYAFTILHAAHCDRELHGHGNGAAGFFLCDNVVLVAFQDLALFIGVVIVVGAVEHLAAAAHRNLAAGAGDLDAHPQALGSARQLFAQRFALGFHLYNVVCGAEAADQGVVLIAIVTCGPGQRGVGAHVLAGIVSIGNGQVVCGVGFFRIALNVVQRVACGGLSHACHIVGCLAGILQYVLRRDQAILVIVGIVCTIAGILRLDVHFGNVHIVAFDLDAAVLVVVGRQLYVVHVGHGGNQVFAAFLAALGGYLFRSVMIVFGKGIGVVVIAPDVVLIIFHGSGGDQVDLAVLTKAVNIVAGAIGGGNVTVQCAALEVEVAVVVAQAAALGGIVGGDAGTVHGHAAAVLVDSAAARGGLVAGNGTGTHQAGAAVHVPACAVGGRVAGNGNAAHQAAAAVLVHAAATFGTGVAGDAAAGQGHGAARLVDRAVFAGIAADLALGHGKLSAAVVGNVDDTVLGCAVVGDRTALQRVAALGNVDCTAVAAGAERCILKDAAVGDDRVIGLGKAAVDDIYRAAAARLAAGDGAAPAKGEAAAAVHADRTAAVRRTAVGDGGIGHSDVGIAAQQQCAAVGSGAADGAAADNGNIAFNGQGGFAADARNGITRQIQRDVGVLADLGAGVGIGQQLDSQLLGGILRQHGAGGIHSNLQAVVGAANDLAVLYDLRDLGFHLGHAQGQGVSALDGVVVDGFIFQGLAGILVQPAAIVVDLRCLGQVQYGIGLGLVGIHILAQLGAVVFHRAVRNLDDEGAVVRITDIFIRADAAAVCQRGIIGHRTAGDVQGLGGGGVGHVEIVVVVLVALFRLLIARHVDTAAIVGRIAGDFAIGQVDTAVAVFIILAIGIQAAAIGFGSVAGDSGFGHVQRGQLARINAARRAAAGVVGDVAIHQVDR